MLPDRKGVKSEDGNIYNAMFHQNAMQSFGYVLAEAQWGS